MKIAAVTCARMDSARFPGKCLAPLLGKPLIQHTIDFARLMEWPLYVWTRDVKILEYVGGRCLVVYEPLELYDTRENSTVEKMAYANLLIDADYLVLLQPTHPFRDPKVVAGWIAQFLQRSASASPRYGSVGYSAMNHPLNMGQRGPSGSFFIYSREYLQHRFDIEPIMFLEDPPVDIHTPADLEEAERCARA